MKRADLVAGTEYLVGPPDWASRPWRTNRVILLSTDQWVQLTDTYGAKRSNGEPHDVVMPDGQTITVTHVRPAYALDKRVGVLAWDTERHGLFNVRVVTPGQIRATWAEAEVVLSRRAAEAEASREAQAAESRELNARTEALRATVNSYGIDCQSMLRQGSMVTLPLAVLEEIVGALPAPCSQDTP